MIPTDPSKQTILCIDDDDSILRYEKALLERSGYAVLTAASAQQGLMLAIARNVDAVLLDYEMAGMNGDEVATEIKLVKPEMVISCCPEAKSQRRRWPWSMPLCLKLKQGNSCCQ